MQDSIWMLFLSDLHLGSAYSIWPPSFLSSSGVELNLNVGQRYIWENWRCIIKDIEKLTGGKGPDIVCEVGDSVHGSEVKERGEYVIEPDLYYQGKAAIHIIQMVKPPTAMFFKFRGTRYHVGDQAETEEWIGEILGAAKDDFGRSCWMWLPNLDVGGVIFDIAHNRSHVLAYRSMPLERERVYANQIPASIKDCPDLIVRGHAHVSGYVEIDGEASLGLPPMQLQTPYCKTSKAPNRLFSKYLGAAMVEVFPENNRTANQPFQIHWLRFLHPPLPRYTYQVGEKKE